MATSGSSAFVSVYVPGNDYSKGLGDQQKLSSLKHRSVSMRRCWNRLSRLQKSFLLMMLIIAILFAAIVTTTTWMPGVDSQVNRYAPHGNIVDNERVNQNFYVQSKGNNAYNSNKNEPEPQQQIQIPANQLHMNYVPTLKSPNTKGRHRGKGQKWTNGKISHSPSSTVPTIPRALQPDFGDDFQGQKPQSDTNTEMEKTRNQIAENIRSVISLDPVVPLGGQKKGSVGIIASVIKGGGPFNQVKKPVSQSRKLKFEGPGNSRQKAVVEAFVHSWNGYKKYAWGRDNLKPISGDGNDWFGLGLTLVDSLDTMYIMGLDREFFEARDWVEDSLNFEGNKNVNLFETTIRVLGGLLSAYHLSGDQMFLQKAQKLGNILLVAFKSPSGVPYSDVNLKTKMARGPSWNPDSTTSEVTTLQLEFRDLSRCTKLAVFEEAAMNVSTHIHKLNKPNGLVPININPSTGSFRTFAVITLGARADSYYEYLLKQWIQTGKKIDFLRDDYLVAVEGMRSMLMRKTHPSNLTFMGELENGGNSFKPKMDHLVCYLPGTLALGVTHGLPAWHLDIAKELLYTCYLTYKRQPTGLAPEITYFRTETDSVEDFYVRSNDAHNLLRPETIESLWYLYQITGDKMYQDWGWEIFESFNKYTRFQYGYSSISSVLKSDDVRPRDMMESFFLGETLKYFYLLFSDKIVFELDQWIFNTEAHPLPVDSNVQS